MTTNNNINDIKKHNQLISIFLTKIIKEDELRQKYGIRNLEDDQIVTIRDRYITINVANANTSLDEETEIAKLVAWISAHNISKNKYSERKILTEEERLLKNKEKNDKKKIKELIEQKEREKLILQEKIQKSIEIFEFCIRRYINKLNISEDEKTNLIKTILNPYLHNNGNKQIPLSEIQIVENDIDKGISEIHYKYLIQLIRKNTIIPDSIKFELIKSLEKLFNGSNLLDITLYLDYFKIFQELLLNEEYDVNKFNLFTIEKGDPLLNFVSILGNFLGIKNEPLKPLFPNTENRGSNTNNDPDNDDFISDNIINNGQNFNDIQYPRENIINNLLQPENIIEQQPPLPDNIDLQAYNELDIINESILFSLSIISQLTIAIISAISIYNSIVSNLLILYPEVANLQNLTDQEKIDIIQSQPNPQPSPIDVGVIIDDELKKKEDKKKIILLPDIGFPNFNLEFLSSLALGGFILYGLYELLSYLNKTKKNKKGEHENNITNINIKNSDVGLNLREHIN